MKTLYGQRYYKPREIAKLGLIRNSTGGNSEHGNYAFVIMLIKTGRLKARTYNAGGKTPYYLVAESSIRKYHDTEANNG